MATITDDSVGKKLQAYSLYINHLSKTINYSLQKSSGLSFTAVIRNLAVYLEEIGAGEINLYRFEGWFAIFQIKQTGQIFYGVYIVDPAVTRETVLEKLSKQFLVRTVFMPE